MKRMWKWYDECWNYTMYQSVHKNTLDKYLDCSKNIQVNPINSLCIHNPIRLRLSLFKTTVNNM